MGDQCYQVHQVMASMKVLLLLQTKISLYWMPMPLSILLPFDPAFGDFY